MAAEKLNSNFENISPEGIKEISAKGRFNPSGEKFLTFLENNPEVLKKLTKNPESKQAIMELCQRFGNLDLMMKTAQI